MDDIVLVTADSVRYDYADEMSFLSTCDVKRGITAAHYTRPSLAALLSSQYRAAIRTQPVSPTLPEALAGEDYTCIGLAPTPQTDPEFGFGAGFDTYETFYDGSGNALEERTSSLREYLGQFDLVRRVYRLFSPMGAVLDDIPSDEELIDRAIEAFNDAEPPRFLWIHLMESHRPYGTGDDAISTSLDRKAEQLGGGSLLGPDELTDEEAERIDDAYRDALGRVDAEVERLLSELDTDPLFAFTSDHGEELGEEGFYYHQGYRRRVPDSIVRVPAVVRGVDVAGQGFSLLDLGPTLLEAAGVDRPEQWDGVARSERPVESTITIAPWHDETTVLWQDFERRLICRDSDVSLYAGGVQEDVQSSEVSEDLERRLENLGYVDAG